MVQKVVLAGGKGARLWPFSREDYPKQFLKLITENTMLQDTIARIGVDESDSPLIVCNEQHRFLVAEQLREKNIRAEILLEPVGRDTAPAILVAALHISKREDDLMLVLPADHTIQDCEDFSLRVEEGVELAAKGEMVTFGVKPRHPETGYGYIEKGKKSGTGYKVNKFIEKPSLIKAREYIRSGEYLWNSGMFLFRASALISEVELHAPDILEQCRIAYENVEYDRDFIRLSKVEFQKCRSISVDYAVMEKSKNVSVLPIDKQWSDIGSWSTLSDVLQKDSEGNVVIGNVESKYNKNTLLKSTGRLIVALGLEDTIVVETSDALLVTSKAYDQEIKKIVEELRVKGGDEYKGNVEVYRPWGKYNKIDGGARYKVKRITVEPGNRLSVQMHHHRAEHWVVVSGTASVGRGNDEMILTENESIYIPIGCTHWLENKGKIPLEIIEVQTGTYLEEDDIVRFDDKYGRK